jgi:hypothetical protein
MLNIQTGSDLSHQILNDCLSRVGQNKHPSNWITFNAVCCRHNNESIDRRNRGNFLLTSEGGLVYNCFNCNFKSGWSPGHRLGVKFQQLLEWFNIPRDHIVRYNYIAFLLKEQPLIDQVQPVYSYEFEERSLPLGSKSFTYWLAQTPIDQNFMKVVDYVCQRGDDVITSYDFYWSPKMATRVIIPFKWKERFVGYTARSIIEGKRIRRYHNDSQPNYLFNIDSITSSQKYIILCEGPFDALAIGAVATLGNHLSGGQCQWLNNTGKTIVVLPDREGDGGALVDIALRENWYVSFPKFASGVKDASEAVKIYGKLYTLWSVLTYKSIRPNHIKTNRKILFR